MICKGIRLRLIAEVIAGAGAVASIIVAARLAGADGMPLVGWGIGYGLVVIFVRLARGAQ